MKKIILLPAIVIILIAITGVQSCKNSDAPAGSVLKFNLEKNKQYDYDITWDTDQKMMDRDNRVNVRAGYSFEVTEEKDNVKTLRGTYNSFRLYMKIMDIEMDIDTEKPVGNPGEDDQVNMMKNIFNRIKGKAFTIKADEEGNVLSVDGFDQIINGIVDSAGVNEDMKLQMRASLQDQFNEQELKDQFSQVFMIFPNKTVKPGDSWKKNYRRGGKLPADFSTTYTVKTMDEGRVTLDAKTIISSTGKEMEVKGEQSGTLLVDSKTGLVINAEFIQDMDAKTPDFGIKVNARGKIEGKER